MGAEPDRMSTTSQYLRCDYCTANGGGLSAVDRPGQRSILSIIGLNPIEQRMVAERTVLIGALRSCGRSRNVGYNVERYGAGEGRARRAAPSPPFERKGLIKFLGAVYVPSNACARDAGWPVTKARCRIGGR